MIYLKIMFLSMLCKRKKKTTASLFCETRNGADILTLTKLLWFQYIIRPSDIVIIPEIKDSKKRRWPLILAFCLFLFSAAVLISALLLKLRHRGNRLLLIVISFSLLFLINYLHVFINNVMGKTLKLL